MSRVKTNDPEASRRKNALPRASKVVDAKEEPKACLKAGRKQLLNDGDENSLSVIPNGRSTESGASRIRQRPVGKVNASTLDGFVKQSGLELLVIQLSV
jgi:hypothetical protein